MYRILSTGIPWNIVAANPNQAREKTRTQVCISPQASELIYQEKTSDWWNIPWYSMRKHCITILYHDIHVENETALCDAKIKCNTVEYSSIAFLYLDWLYIFSMAWYKDNYKIIIIKNAGSLDKYAVQEFPLA